MQKNIRVLVVDDSIFMRSIITDILNSDEEIEVVGTASNGYEAIEKVKQLNPDVITLDIEMPVMDGLSCLKELKGKKGCSVVMLSSLTLEGAKATIQALEYGAIDFITKPTNIFGISAEDKKREIIEKVKVAKHAKVKSSQALTDNIIIKNKTRIKKSKEIRKIIAIGTSTGGPRALQDVIPQIPGDIPAAVLIVQHMPPGFTKSLAARLDSISQITVKEAEDGDIVQAGYAYIAPGDYHMTFERLEQDNLKIILSKKPPVGGLRPSVDVMMNSLSETGLKNIIAVIMTGMGSDGSEGIKKIKAENNGYIIAQDKESCVVYGMPAAAYRTGVVDSVVPLKSIAKEIMKNVGVL